MGAEECTPETVQKSSRSSFQCLMNVLIRNGFYLGLARAARFSFSFCFDLPGAPVKNLYCRKRVSCERRSVLVASQGFHC